MAWDVEFLYTDPESKRELPFLISSGQFSAWYKRSSDEPQPTSGAVIGLFIKDERTRQLIRDRDPIVMNMFVGILDEIDEIVTVMWFDEHWEGYDDDAALERDANIVLQSRFSNDCKKDYARNALAHLEKRKLEEAEKKAKQYYSHKRRNQFAGSRPDLMLALIDRDGYQCKNCGDQNDLAIDHITPLSKGGSDDLGNLQILCRSCNSSKGDSL